ncbi:MAG: ATP-binding cassette domain-containing protein [Candidatus Dormibacteraeota bacterium]|jgi:ABC-type glutathione transport system ATPase component|nr:ATP-binding cassette domain-containing protein [Candidatus Dormibacteraeota bacterium]MDQ6921164.1 ATP-binding cassette domain-containing protein [Candidatus Dormibacteraeota bacterium]
MSGEALFEVRGVSKHFRLPRTSLLHRPGLVTAVEDVSFELREGETLGVVGESGSGKTTLMRLMLRLEEPDQGQIGYRGGSLRREVQAVFQDPVSALDPRMRVADIVLEPLRVLRVPGDRRARLAELLEAVGLPSGAARRYPHEFSGGQRQRIAIARALAPRPRVLLADEPVSALDVSVRAQILNLLEDLRLGYRLTLVLVSHDLSVVRQMSDRVLVMHRGRIVEAAETRRLFREPQHPYTRALLDSVPRLKKRRAASR